ncbi:MAG: ATP-binding protein, partial [Alistipes sp.]|nr:ATP-binding protein [Candidatus Minthomonas equi]
GWWTFVIDYVPVDLYLEIDSKPLDGGAVGYPALLLETRSGNRSLIPSHYSYAKYYEDKLVSSSGEYVYSMTFRETEGRGEQYYHRRSDGYIHFCNHTSSDGKIVMSRPLRRWHQYMMFISYLFLFFAVIILLYVYLIGRRITRREDVPVKKTFRRRITLFLVLSLLVALAVMGVGSIVFIIHLSDINARSQMQEKMKTVQSSLSVFFKHANDYREINNLNMFNAMDGVSANTKVDINLYDTHGSLIRSTKPEIFTRYLASSRMDPDAFESILYGEKLMVIQMETIAGMRYHSLYAPVFNEDGTVIAVINIPFFMDRSGFRQGNSSFIIATIINIYLLLLIFTLFWGTTMSNAVSRPITLISRRMQEMNISQEPHHLHYKGDDELGVLVKSYNKMVDDVKSSTVQLAQSEREQAWREMARQIAHEIKNPLTPMKLSLQHLIRMKKMNVQGWEDRLDSLSESLIEQIDILSNTASEFSSFAKFYNEDDIEFDLISLLKEELLLFDSGDDIGVEFCCELDSAFVKLKKSQITRAFVNLISNAFQALENVDSGKVRISLSKNGDMFRIDVEDNGNGVLEENLDKLFKPNFTTKTSGTGLGLAITRNIVEQSRGHI